MVKNPSACQSRRHRFNPWSGGLVIVRNFELSLWTHSTPNSGYRRRIVWHYCEGLLTFCPSPPSPPPPCWRWSHNNNSLHLFRDHKKRLITRWFERKSPTYLSCCLPLLKSYKVSLRGKKRPQLNFESRAVFFLCFLWTHWLFLKCTNGKGNLQESSTRPTAPHIHVYIQLQPWSVCSH